MMKSIIFSISVLFIACLLTYCAGNGKDKPAEADSTEISSASKVQVIYFHGERRCPTCIAVGDNAAAAIKENFSTNSDVEFLDLNIEDEKHKSLVEKYEVSGSALMVICGEKFENLTGFGFQNARSRPEVFKQKIKEVVDAYLK